MLEVKNLHAHIGDKEILRGIDLTIRDGETHAIMGPNGSGKSTLSAVLVGNPIYEVTEGTVIFNGKDLLAMKPEVLILDEPTAGLDPKGREDILGLIKKLHDEMGITIILVSHSMDDVANYVDRIIVMNKGRVAFDDVPTEVFKHYKELEEIGLAAPQVTYVMQELREAGFPVDTNVTTLDAAKIEILKAFGKC